MQYKPMLFNTQMVRAILAGKKTMTRRLITPQPQARLCYIFAGKNFGKWHYPPKYAQGWGKAFQIPTNISLEEREKNWNPPAHAGDILWVRETWKTTEKCGLYPDWPIEGSPHYIYKADDLDCDATKFARWYPSIHMPKAAARIFLRVQSVSCQRIQEITTEECVREGIDEDMENVCGEGAARDSFRILWDSTVKISEQSQYGWNANPWVWRIAFERCEKPEGWPIS